MIWFWLQFSKREKEKSEGKSLVSQSEQQHFLWLNGFYFIFWCVNKTQEMSSVDVLVHSSQCRWICVTLIHVLFQESHCNAQRHLWETFSDCTLKWSVYYIFLQFLWKFAKLCRKLAHWYPLNSFLVRNFVFIWRKVEKNSKKN